MSVLNLNFFYIFMYAPQIIFFFYFIVILVLNYLFYTNFFLKKKIVEKIGLDIFILVPFIIFINVIYFNCRYNSFLLVNFFFFFKYIYILYYIVSFLVIVILCLFKYFYKKSTIVSYNRAVAPSFLILFFCIITCNDFLFLFLFLELFGYIFYLQFLQTFKKLKTKKINNFYFDGLLLYYWSNFFGSFLILYSVIFLFYICNTTNFYELLYFSNNTRLIFFYYIWFVGFSLKLGLPGLHFFKLEIYKSLRLDSIINFSFLSLIGYLILLKLIFLKVFFLLNFSIFIIIFCLFTILIINVVSLRNSNIILFFGYSTILNALLMLFIII